MHPNKPALLSKLANDFGNRFSISSPVLEAHGRGESYHPTAAPDGVVYVQSVDEVSKVSALCHEAKVPMIPFGVGTSLEGHVAALEGGICLDFSLMDQILEINQEDLDCRVQAGVTRKQLNEELRATGLFFPIDPGANATIGGMTATRASGTNAVRYGTMRDVVMGLTAVMADGRIVKTGTRARKSSAGYDLTRLLVGSEGTLAHICEVQLRLFGQPEQISAAVCPFPDLESAAQTTIAVLQYGIPVARVELLDALTVKAVNAYSKLQLEETPTLFFEFHGTEAWAAEQAQLTAEIAHGFGGKNFEWATTTEERNRLWQARHDAYYAQRNLRPGSTGYATDLCVPISNLASCIIATQELLDSAGVLAPLVGHVGDGNYHSLILVDPDDPTEVAQASQLGSKMIDIVHSFGGTCTGEHGVGYGKIPYLEKEAGAAFGLMRTIKTALDPLNLMNPGKIVPIHNH